MEKINIALLAGGDSSEREVSLGSAGQVLDALDLSRYNVFLIDVRGADWKYVSDDGRSWDIDKNDFSVTIADLKTSFDYALILIHGTPGEDGKLQAYFDIMRIPYSSCGMVSSVITFDKEMCKKTVASAGINLAKEVFILPSDRVDPDEMISALGLPMFIKPNASGSSFGVTKVKNRDEILPAVKEAFRESGAVLAEEFVEGREIACGVMITGEKEYVFPLTEIISKNDFFDYRAKYTPGLSDEITPAAIDENTARSIREMSLGAYRACRCRGIVRIDFIVRADGTPVMIEVNSIPGMSAGSIVPKQAAVAGITLGELYDIVIRDTFFKRQL